MLFTFYAWTHELRKVKVILRHSGQLLMPVLNMSDIYQAFIQTMTF